MRSPPLIYFLLTLFIIPGLSFSQKPYKTGKDVPKCVSPQLHNLNKRSTGNNTILGKERETGKTIDPNFIEIGNASNAYSFAGNTRTILWADEHSDAVTLIHKLDSLYSGYDVSFDRGQTWSTNIQLGNFRFPQGGILNLSSLSNNDSTFLTYIGIVDDGTELNKFTWGVHCLNQANPPLDTIIHSRSEPTCAFTISQSGIVFYVMKLVDSIFQYQDTLIIMNGEYDPEEQLFEYSLSNLFAPIDHQNGAELIDVKIAFGPDGQIGYLAVLSDNGTIPFSSGSYYPILYKTDDGGESWTGPEAIQLGGPDGFYSVKHFLSDLQLEEFFEPPIPHRDSILYSTGYDIDVTVDREGNPHLITVIGIGDSDYGIYTPPEYFSVFTIGKYESNTWEAWELDKLDNFRGDFGDLIEDNRPQIVRSFEGDMVYYFWLDTDTNWSNENNYPDTFITSWSLDCQYAFPPSWTSEFTPGWLTSNFGGISDYIYGIEECSVPVYYLHANSPMVASETVTTFSLGWGCTNYSEDYITVLDPVKINTPEETVRFTVLPNPAKDYLLINLNPETKGDIFIYDYLGREKYFSSIDCQSTRIDVSSYILGIYFILFKTSSGATYTYKVVVK